MNFAEAYQSTLKIEPKTLPPFKVFIDDQTVPIIEYNGVNGYSIYKVTPPTNGGGYIKPILDKDGKPILLKMTDPDYYDNLFNTFFYGCGKYVQADDPSIESIILTIYFPERKDVLGDMLCGGEFRYYTKKSDKSAKIMGLGVNYNNFKAGTICYIDNNFQIEWRIPQNNNLVVSRREAINPDDYLLKKTTEIPGITSMKTVYYSYSASVYGIGYAKMKPGSDLYYLNGIEYDFVPNTDKVLPIETKNGKTMVDYGFLIGIINCAKQTMILEDDSGTRKAIQLLRLFFDKEKDKVLTLNVSFEFGNKKYYDNGQIKYFTVAPYGSNAGVMVPLKEVCEALQAKVIYRPHDGTILISRFFEY